MSTHTQNRCTLCKKSFTSKSHLKRHKLTAHIYKMKRFECAICKKYFTRKDYLKVHELKHTKETKPEKTKPFRCTQCRMSFNSKRSLRRHKLTSHTKGTKPFACTQCEKCFARSDHLKVHTLTHVKETKPEKAKPFTCTKCEKSFTFKRCLVRHVRTSHTKEKKPFACTQCEKYFTRRDHLKGHMSTHTKEKLKCEQCGKGFGNESSLSRHRRTHTNGPRPFVCKLCQKSFVQNYHLRRHMLTHYKEKHFQCWQWQCEESFCDENSLDGQVCCHTDFECAICGKGFAWKYNLTKHIQRKHSNPLLGRPIRTHQTTSETSRDKIFEEILEGMKSFAVVVPKLNTYSHSQIIKSEEEAGPSISHPVFSSMKNYVFEGTDDIIKEELNIKEEVIKEEITEDGMTIMPSEIKKEVNTVTDTDTENDTIIPVGIKEYCFHEEIDIEEIKNEPNEKHTEDSLYMPVEIKEEVTL